MLAAQGYCVVQIDSRGSQHRGLKFESHLRGRMVSTAYPIVVRDFIKENGCLIIDSRHACV